VPSRPALLLLALGLAACTDRQPDTIPAPTRTLAPEVVLPTADGPIDLATLAGRPVLLQFAQADDAEAWAALADAFDDLQAAGATVVAVTVDGKEDAAAEAFGYDGAPLAVIVDGEGAVRGRGAPDSGDALFALAGPVLAEADVAETVEWAGAETLDALVEAGGLVVDVSEAAPRIRYALRLAADTMAVEDLPADLGTPLAFVGPEAETAAERATRWGYAAVYVADADGALTPVGEATYVTPPRRSGGVRG